MIPCNKLVLPEEIAAEMGSDDPFERVMHLQGEVFRDVPGRRTLRFQVAGESYFAKLHYGVGWGEIFKNLLTFRLPVISAATEWQAIQRLDALGIPTTPAIGYGRRGTNPAAIRSFIVTQDLGNIVSLEDFCRDWPINPPSLSLKRKLLRRVAEVAKGIHDHGLNHRDFYLCHLCLDGNLLEEGDLRLYLIDLHRMQVRKATPVSARMKDMAALYFSALDIGLTKRDILRFLRLYRGKRLRVLFDSEQAFLERVDRRARKLYHKFHGRWPVTPFDHG